MHGIDENKLLFLVMRKILDQSYCVHACFQLRSGWIPYGDNEVCFGLEIHVGILCNMVRWLYNVFQGDIGRVKALRMYNGLAMIR